MKILHILDHSLPLHSGYSFRSQSIFQAQRKRGWEPVIVTSPKHEESWKGSWAGHEELNTFSYYRTGPVSDNGLPLAGEIRLMATLGRRIEEVAKSEKPDLLHAHSPMLNAISALWVGLKLKIPVVYEIRAFWEDAGVDHGTYVQNSPKYRLVRSLESWVCRRAGHIAVLCNGLKQDLIERGISSNKISVVYNGVNVDDFSAKQPDPKLAEAYKVNGKKVIGFIGSFYRYEGLDLLIKAFSIIADRYPDLVLLLVGGGELENELKKLKKQFKLSNRVLMPGRIPHDRIPGVYALIDVLAYPRYSMRLTEMVTPLKPLEALAMGKAVVASDVGGHKELIRHGETGLLFPAGNAAALAECLERLLDFSALRKKLQKRGGTWVRQHHTWEKTTSAYSDIYAKALRR
jgi:PEP-CTERM/exosortase A-associated glycosyltransferase